MKVNTQLSLNGCWNMVNRIQLADTPSEIRERCGIAEYWLTNNKVISVEEYDELMQAVAYFHRESYRMN